MIQKLEDDHGCGLPVREDVSEVLGAEDIPEGGGGQQPRRQARVLHVADGGHRVVDLVVDDGVHGNGHGVLER